MKELLLKSTIAGLILGTLFFAIAPLGLGLSLIESLKPVLAPGVYLVQLLGKNTVGLIPLLLALCLNVFIYSLLVLSILLSHAHLSRSE